MLSSTIVTPDRRHNRCQERRRFGYCSCWQAQFPQACQSCGRQIYLEDCITAQNIQGRSHWTHSECQGHEERGLTAIEAGFNNNIDYSSSFISRLGNSDGNELPSRRLELEFDAESSSAAVAAGTKRSATISQEDDEEDDAKPAAVKRESNDDNEDEDHNIPTYKRAKREEIGLSTIDGGDTDDADYADKKRTNEQMEILYHEPEVGDVVAVNALAGCGKTTTISLLCEKVKMIHPDKDVLYLVFNKRMKEEAAQSNKFAQDVEIRTTHSYVLQHFFGVENMHKINLVVDYRLEDIIEELDLISECRSIFSKTLQELGQRGEQVLNRRVKTIAGYIRNTVKLFQASSDTRVEDKHVFWRARKNTNLTKRTKWRGQVGVKKYKQWARQFFGVIHKTCLYIQGGRVSGERSFAISHDGYLKVAQLQKLVIPHNYLFLDEAQDMTSCQADLFWGPGQRNGKIIYLFGDKYQQIYRWRGASNSFRDMVDASNPKLTLTGSFRFGKNIASCATAVLKALGGDTLHGRSTSPGLVEKFAPCGHSEMDKCVVLCRTQIGCFAHLYANTPHHWCYLDGESEPPRHPKQYEYDLESFLHSLKDKEGKAAEEGEGGSGNGGGESFLTYKGESFLTVEDIEEYIDDEGDTQLARSLRLLQFLVSRGKPIDDFYSDLLDSFSPMQEHESPNNYRGTILSTVHKAKGLEFNCPVVISDDFRFGAIKSAVVNSYRHCDEANILYVTITRAKQHLYLSEGAHSCLDYLSKLDHVNVELPPMFSLDSSQAQFSLWQEAWSRFKEGSDHIESLFDIPYPPEWNNDSYPLAIHPSMSVSKQRKQLWSYLRIYHTDKFFPRFGHRLSSEAVKGGVQIILKQITRKCLEILESLQEEEEHLS